MGGENKKRRREEKDIYVECRGDPAEKGGKPTSMIRLIGKAEAWLTRRRENYHGMHLIDWISSIETFKTLFPYGGNNKRGSLLFGEIKFFGTGSELHAIPFRWFT